MLFYINANSTLTPSIATAAVLQSPSALSTSDIAELVPTFGAADVEAGSDGATHTVLVPIG
jgi:hypothetical protein